MARSRNIKPGFFSNDDLVELPFEARLLFIGLWTIADRAGRLLDRPKKIKMDVFPGDNVDVEACLAMLASGGFIRRYEALGVNAIQVSNWEKHQNPHVKEAASTIPYQGQSEASIVQAPCKNDAKPVKASEIPERAGLIPDSLNLIPDSGFLIPDPPKKTKAPPSPSGEVLSVFEYWQKTMGHTSAQLDDVRHKKIKARLKDGYTAEQLCKAVDGCKMSPYHQGQNENRTIYDDIELICRDGPKVDGFIKKSEAVPAGFRTSNQQQTLDNLQRYLKKDWE